MSNYDKLKKLISQIDVLLESKVTSYASDFKSWHGDCKRFLTNTYGKDSIELENFTKTKFQCAIIDDEQQRLWCKNGLETTKSMFNSLLDDMEIEEPSDETNNDSTNNKVFIVHGHDNELKYKVACFLIKIGLDPIILHEQVNSSRTIIEKIEEYGSEAQAAVILFTPDDVGKAKNDKENKLRSRQNVVFEAGYFMGLLGRNKTMLIVSDSSIELPGDLQGVVYSEDSSEFKIAKELKAMGLQIDMNKLL